MLPFPGVKFIVGWSGGCAGDAKQRAKSVERIEASVEAKSEFVQVGLKVLVADSVMDAEQP
jgi:hypothetical protein